MKLKCFGMVFCNPPNEEPLWEEKLGALRQSLAQQEFNIFLWKRWSIMLFKKSLISVIKLHNKVRQTTLDEIKTSNNLKLKSLLLLNESLQGVCLGIAWCALLKNLVQPANFPLALARCAIQEEQCCCYGNPFPQPFNTKGQCLSDNIIWYWKYCFSEQAIETV